MGQPEHSTDDLQWRFAAGEGDGAKQALAELIEAHRSTFERTAARYIGSAQATDLIQEFFLHAWRRRAAYDAKQPWLPWAVSLLRNLAISLLRKSSARKRGGGMRRHDLAALAARDDQAMRKPDEAATWNEWECRLGEELAMFDEIDRLLLKGRYRLGKSVAELARWLHLNPNTAASRLRRATLRLRERLADFDPEDGHDPR